MTALRRGVDLWGVISFGLGAAVGVAIFSVIAPAVAVGGPGMLLAVAIAAAPMFVIALNYAFLGSVLPTSGASFAWPSRFLHPAIGFGIAWLRAAGTTGAIVVLALVFTRYLAMVLPVPVKPTMAALFTLIAAANIVGVGMAARIQGGLMAVLLVIFALFVVLGLPAMRTESFVPLLPHGALSVLETIPLLVGLFFGIEAATEAGDEVHDARRTIPLGIAVSLGAALLVYAAVASVAIGVAGPAAIAGSDTPLLAAAAHFLGPFATPLVVTAALIAIAKSLNAQFLIFSRSMLAMARAGVLPAPLARVDARRGTPVSAIVAVWALSMAGLLLPTSLTFLFLGVNVPTLLKYAAISLSADRVVTRHPAVYAAAPFHLPRRWARATAFGGVICAVLVALLGIGTDVSPYVALTIWALLGVPVWLMRNKAQVSANTTVDGPNAG